jgi:hypothetical protein
MSATAHYRRSLEKHRPDGMTSRHSRWELASFHMSLAYVLLAQGRLEDAKAGLTLALASMPDSSERAQWLRDLAHLHVLHGTPSLAPPLLAGGSYHGRSGGYVCQAS